MGAEIQTGATFAQPMLFGDKRDVRAVQNVMMALVGEEDSPLRDIALSSADDGSSIVYVGANWTPETLPAGRKMVIADENIVSTTEPL